MTQTNYQKGFQALKEIESLVCDVLTLADITLSLAEAMEFDRSARTVTMTYDQGQRLHFMLVETEHRAKQLHGEFYKAVEMGQTEAAS